MVLSFDRVPAMSGGAWNYYMREAIIDADAAVPSGIVISWKPALRAVEVPLGYAVFLFGLLAPLPWLRWKFSLRTLLITTTLVAVVLGLAAWAAGKK